jgi:hypothetical protein
VGCHFLVVVAGDGCRAWFGNEWLGYGLLAQGTVGKRAEILLPLQCLRLLTSLKQLEKGQNAVLAGADKGLAQQSLKLLLLELPE